MTDLVLIRFDGPEEQLQLTADRVVRRGEITPVTPATADLLDSYERVRITRMQPPPLIGVGSGRRPWAEYAAGLGIDVTHQMSRDEIVRAVSQQPKATTGRKPNPRKEGV